MYKLLFISRMQLLLLPRLPPSADASETFAQTKSKAQAHTALVHTHSQPRSTNTIGAVARVRNALAFATHTFFQSRGFYYVHTPIITASDCEGAGEMFAVRGASFHVMQQLPARRPCRDRSAAAE